MCGQTEEKVEDACFVPKSEEEMKKYKGCEDTQCKDHKPKYGKSPNLLTGKPQDDCGLNGGKNLNLTGLN